MIRTAELSPRPRARLAALLSLSLLAPLSCHHRPHVGVPTRSVAAGASMGGTGARQTAEILDTDDGPIPIDALDPQLGPRDARCVIVVFSDFECPFCKDVAEVLSRLHAQLPKDVRIVFKHFPLGMHVDAKTAAIAAQVVFLEAGSDAFWRFHDHAFAHQAEISSKTLAEWAAAEGASNDAIATRGHEADQRVVDDLALGRSLGLSGTPHLYINGRSIAGAFPYDDVRGWVDDEL